jgi:hypothetical protein
MKAGMKAKKMTAMKKKMTIGEKDPMILMESNLIFQL